MLVAFLALLAAAAEPNTVAPVTVTATPKAPADATVDVAGSDEFSGDYVAIWPATAHQAGARGEVTLACYIDIHGLAERCRVVSETPQRRRFGEAALALRPTFLLKPKTGPDGQPIGSTMSIKVRFEPPKNNLRGSEGINAGIRGIGDPRNIIENLPKFASNPLAIRPQRRRPHGSVIAMGQALGSAVGGAANDSFGVPAIPAAALGMSLAAATILLFVFPRKATPA